MDLFNRAFAQLNDLFRSMTPGSRVTAGLLLLVVVVSVGYLFNHQVITADVDLMPGVAIPPNQMLVMKSAFGKANLKNYEICGNSIRVPHGEEGAYLTALMEANAMPPDLNSVLREAVSNDNMFTGNQQRAQRAKSVLQDMLALGIRQKFAAESVCVTYDVETKPGLRQEKQITALVNVKLSGNAQLDEKQVISIRYLVAGGAIAGLKPDDVTVADLSPNGRTWYGKIEANAGEGDKLYALKRAYEDDLKHQIQAVLRYIPNLTLGVNVEFSSERLPHTQITKRDAPAVRQDASANMAQGVVPVETRAAKEQSLNAATVIGSVLGGKSNAKNNAAAMQNVVPDPAPDVVNQENIPLPPTLAKVSLGIPLSYFEKIWRDHHPGSDGKNAKDPDPATMNALILEKSTEIRRQVAQFLPSIEGVADPMEQVVVTAFEDPIAKEAVQPAWEQIGLAWLEQHGNMAVLVGLACISLFLLRSMVKSGTAETPSDSVYVATSMKASEDEPLAAIPMRRPAQKNRLDAGGLASRGSASQEELSEIVRQDPHAAANILRTWVGNTG
jgi:flagellar M-ring protein FliF